MDQQKPTATDGLDLFGMPLLPIRDRRGRKSYRKDPENQRFVARRAADGWTQEMIAEDMGIDAKTLRKHFSRELEMGRVFMVGEMLDILHRRAREGHVPSVKALLERYDNQAPVAPRRTTPVLGDDDDDAPDADPESPRGDLGKKERRDLAAQEQPDSYGDIFKRLRQH